MKRHGHKSKFKHFAAGAALALLVVAAAPAGADYFAQVTGSFGGGETMGAPTGGSGFGGGMTSGSSFGGGTTGGMQQGGMTSQFSQSSMTKSSQMGGQNSGQQPGTGKQMGGSQFGGGQGSQQGGSNKGGSGTFPGSGSTEGKFPGGGATSGTFPGGTGVKSGQSSWSDDFGEGEFSDEMSGLSEFSMSKKGGTTKGGQGSKTGGQKGGMNKGGQSSVGSGFGDYFGSDLGGDEFGDSFGSEDSFGMMEDYKSQKGKTTKSYGKKSYDSGSEFDLDSGDFAGKMEDSKALKGKKSYGGVFDFESTSANNKKSSKDSSDTGLSKSSTSDWFTQKSAGKKTEFVLEEEEDIEEPDFDAAFDKVLSGVDKIKTAKKLQTTLASRAESIYTYVCSEDNGFDCEGDKALSKATTKLQKDFSKTKANAKTLKKDFKAYVNALKGVVEDSDEWEEEE